MASLRRRRLITSLVLLTIAGLLMVLHPNNYRATPDPTRSQPGDSTAIDVLNKIAVKGRAPKAGYQRSQFGAGWSSLGSCDTRNRILYRDLTDAVVDGQCHVISGTLQDPYTGKLVGFVRGANTSQLVQIDHVVALSDAWQKGAQQLSFDRRVDLANDPLNLLAVDGQANQNKGDGDAATWLPPDKAFRCQYVARQVAVKQRYDLWVTPAERVAIERVLSACPNQLLPSEK